MSQQNVELNINGWKLNHTASSLSCTYENLTIQYSLSDDNEFVIKCPALFKNDIIMGREDLFTNFKKAIVEYLKSQFALPEEIENRLLTIFHKNQANLYKENIDEFKILVISSCSANQSDVFRNLIGTIRALGILPLAHVRFLLSDIAPYLIDQNHVAQFKALFGCLEQSIRHHFELTRFENAILRFAYNKSISADDVRQCLQLLFPGILLYPCSEFEWIKNAENLSIITCIYALKPTILSLAAENGGHGLIKLLLDTMKQAVRKVDFSSSSGKVEFSKAIQHLHLRSALVLLEYYGENFDINYLKEWVRTVNGMPQFVQDSAALSQKITSLIQRQESLFLPPNVMRALQERERLGPSADARGLESLMKLLESDYPQFIQPRPALAPRSAFSYGSQSAHIQLSRMDFMQRLALEAQRRDDSDDETSFGTIAKLK